MKKLLRLVLFCVVAHTTQSYAQQSVTLTTADLFKNKKEVYFSFHVNSKAEINALSSVISIDHLSPQQLANNEVTAYANEKEFNNFLQYGYSYTLLPHPASLAPVTMLKDGQPVSALRAFGTYPTYSQYEGFMQQFEIDYPNICKLYTIGVLPSGRKLMVLKISDNINTRENEPQFLYTSTMHGDETTGYPMMLSLIDYLLTNYGTNTRVTNLVNNMEIWICPDANPDGTYYGGNNTVSGAIRYNANGIDLNRNYPDPENGPHPDSEIWQPETVAFMGFADTLDFVMAANFHGGAEVTNYPWDTWNHVHPDLNWWTYECVKWADSAQLVSPPGYMTDLYGSSANPGVTNGYDWYEVNGGRQDYMNWFRHCREMTVELSSTKNPAASQLTNYWDYNRGALLNYMEESMYGIRGIITDACTGLPVKAKVFINSHDLDSSHVYSSLPVGNYHRPIYPGTYSVTYSAPGYQSVTMTGVSVSWNTPTVVNISLQPLSPVAAFTADHTSGCGGTVQFTDLSGSAATWLWDFGDGNTSTVQNPLYTYASGGTYTVTLTVTNCAGNNTNVQPSYLNLTVTPAPVTVNDTASSCAPQSLNLSASGTATLNWYDAASGGNLVNTGSTYTTPVLSNTTTYYVQDVVTGTPQFVGRDSTGATVQGGNFASSNQYLIFDALSDFTLVSVYVNASGTANRTIELRNSSGTVIQSAVVNIPAGGSRVTLNFNVPAGMGYQLGTSGTANLWRNNAGSSYPYTIPGVVSITTNSAGLGGYYYFFYKWKVRQDCASALTPVTAVFNGTSSPVGSAVAPSATSICAGESVTFTATPTNGGSTPSYQWQVNGSNAGTNSPVFTTIGLSNGDLVTCIITSSDTCASNNPATSNTVTMTVFALPATPVISQSGADLTSTASSGNQWYLNGSPVAGATGNTYTPTQNGTYYVIATDGNGCSSDTSNVLNVTNVGIAEAEVFSAGIYPNPADQVLNLVLKGGTGTADITLQNMLGEIVWSRTHVNTGSRLDVSAVPEGMYLLRVRGETTRVFRLVIKHNR